mmetsp:Transcript_27693/g.44526  ORF Transcript_27693/g.44526 Transcript_27693/m.44526 type:complete len:110 (+) Transcript_27693:78-407(+)
MTRFAFSCLQNSSVESAGLVTASEFDVAVWQAVCAMVHYSQWKVLFSPWRHLFCSLTLCILMFSRLHHSPAYFRIVGGRMWLYLSAHEHETTAPTDGAFARLDDIRPRI